MRTTLAHAFLLFAFALGFLASPCRALAASPVVSTPAASPAVHAAPAAPAAPAPAATGNPSVRSVGFLGHEVHWQTRTVVGEQGQDIKVHTLSVHGPTNAAGERSERSISLSRTRGADGVTDRSVTYQAEKPKVTEDGKSDGSSRIFVRAGTEGGAKWNERSGILVVHREQMTAMGEATSQHFEKEIGKSTTPYVFPEPPSDPSLERTIELRVVEPMARDVLHPNLTVRSEIVDERVHLRDPLQGKIGDCYLISAMAAVAQRHPEFVRNAITEMPDGNLKIRLYEPYFEKNEKKFHPVDVIVDKKVPTGFSGPIYAHGEAAWPALIEKAFASLKGNYEAIGNGDYPSNALETLTGTPSHDFVSLSGAQVAATIEAAVKEGRPITASSNRQETFASKMDAHASRGTPSAGYKALVSVADPHGAKSLRDYGIVDGHAYTVLGVGHRNGEAMIVLRNPWGYFEPGRNGIAKGEVQKSGGNGVFAIPADQFALLFHTITTSSGHL